MEKYWKIHVAAKSRTKLTRMFKMDTHRSNQRPKVFGAPSFDPGLR